MSRFAITTLALLVSALTGCKGSVAFEQEVRLKVVGQENAPVAGLNLRYHSEPGCSGEYLAVTTSEHGEASLIRSAQHGTFAVLLEEPSLCVGEDGGWRVLWQEVIDPARVESITCTLLPAPEVCERNPTYGGI
jgi:hypothetical protein